MLDVNIALEAGAGAITAIGGIYTFIRRWIHHSQEKRDKYRQDILHHARAEAEKVREELDEKIQKLEAEIEAQKQDIYKDIGYLKETHSAEIRNLTEKIDNLREDLKVQHVSILNLLTKLVDTK